MAVKEMDLEFQALINQRVKEIERKNQSTGQRESEDRSSNFYEQILAKSNIPAKFRKKTFQSYKKVVENSGTTYDLSAKVEFMKDFSAKDYSFAYLAGNVGNGKTHLAVSAGKKMAYEIAMGLDEELEEFRPHIPDNKLFLHYVNWEIESDKLKGFSNDFDRVGLIEKLQKSKILIIDDIFAKPKLSLADLNNIFQIVDYRYQHDKKTIFTSNRFASEYLTSLTPEDLSDYQYKPVTQEDLDLITDRIASRIIDGCQGKIIEFDAPNYRIVGDY